MLFPFAFVHLINVINIRNNIWHFSNLLFE
ncbi:hypothetical protein PT2222_140362 [Paraburkholderia tropica]